MSRPTKEQVKNASAVVQQWRAQGVPYYVTEYEAHRLTGGKFGRPMGVGQSHRAVHLFTVAVILETEANK